MSTKGAQNAILSSVVVSRRSLGGGSRGKAPVKFLSF